jgi:hypothetical protein
MQMEFIYGRMEPWQIISFAKVCRAYMTIAGKIACEEATQIVEISPTKGEGNAL